MDGNYGKSFCGYLFFLANFFAGFLTGGFLTGAFLGAGFLAGVALLAGADFLT